LFTLDATVTNPGLTVPTTVTPVNTPAASLNVTSSPEMNVVGKLLETINQFSEVPVSQVAPFPVPFQRMFVATRRVSWNSFACLAFKFTLKVLDAIEAVPSHKFTAT